MHNKTKYKRVMQKTLHWTAYTTFRSPVLAVLSVTETMTDPTKQRFRSGTLRWHGPENSLCEASAWNELRTSFRESYVACGQSLEPSGLFVRMASVLISSKPQTSVALVLTLKNLIQTLGVCRYSLSVR